jgi:hypothetical protein
MNNERLVIRWDAFESLLGTYGDEVIEYLGAKQRECRETIFLDEFGRRRNDYAMRFAYPFSGRPDSVVVVPYSAMMQGEPWIKARIEGWFRHHDRPTRGESLRIPDYQFEPNLFQPTM